MDNRRDFLKKATLMSSGAGLMQVLPESIRKALAINPAAGSTFMDAEHIVLLMQENRSFDHSFGSLQGVRGFNDPRAIRLPNQQPVWIQTDKDGNSFAPFHLDITATKATWMSSLPHSWSNQVDALNSGKNNGWLEAKHSGNPEYAGMPLTMGYYTRQDIPFYYALADAFTVCDQHFCSSLTGTTPNRLYYWTGTIRDKAAADAIARVWNGDTDYDRWGTWKTFPERLEDAGISWKVYQNEISVGLGFEGEQDAWLANFTDNPLEFFAQYNVKLYPEYIKSLPGQALAAKKEIEKLELEFTSAAPDKKPELEKQLAALKNYLQKNEREQKIYTLEKFEQLSDYSKRIHEKAFTSNKIDPDYHSLSTLRYKDGVTDREVLVPKGDVLAQFRKDVHDAQLPSVSWLVAPENFSDHPGSAWYGSWYISEVMDILTRNPEVWKKTVLIITYDENDGYFDHVPPFTVPNPYRADTGAVSPGIDCSVEYVRTADQHSDEKESRESAIGLGFRVPMLVISPWSRGGWVCSEVFDHTSSLRFLEKFLSNKFGKKIAETNISNWRRTICGDLSSAFRPYNGESIAMPAVLGRDAEVERIHKAKFREVPRNYKKLDAAELRQSADTLNKAKFLPAQERGTRPSSALPYELYADGNSSRDKKQFTISFRVGTDVFGYKAMGAPFSVYARGQYEEQMMPMRAYAVTAGVRLQDGWFIDRFGNKQYDLEIYGPNGFFRKFTGDEADPTIEINCGYEKSRSRLSGNISLDVQTSAPVEIEITDNAYGQATIRKKISHKETIILSLSKSKRWYDFTVSVKGHPNFSKRYAGRVETGDAGITDPAMA